MPCKIGVFPYLCNSLPEGQLLVLRLLSAVPMIIVAIGAIGYIRLVEMIAYHFGPVSWWPVLLPTQKTSSFSYKTSIYLDLIVLIASPLDSKHWFIT